MTDFGRVRKLLDSIEEDYNGLREDHDILTEDCLAFQHEIERLGREAETLRRRCRLHRAAALLGWTVAIVAVANAVMA